MIFKKLTLKNFKSHINTEVEFNKGTTIILGENGAGKSSIFEGINFDELSGKKVRNNKTTKSKKIDDKNKKSTQKKSSSKDKKKKTSGIKKKITKKNNN